MGGLTTRPSWGKGAVIMLSSDNETGASRSASTARVEQKGYTFRDKLLRPARVLVTPG